MRTSVHYGLNVVSEDAYGGWGGWLNACVNDARDLAVMFGRGGFQSHAFLNEQATLAQFRGDFALAATKLVAGAIYVVTVSGHGGRAGAWTWSGYTETLCLYDGQLADSMLREMLAAFQPGVKVVIILDACHSGGMDRSAKFWRGRVKPVFVKSNVALPAAPLEKAAPITAGVLLLAACQAEETALDGEVNGAFTGTLLETADTAPDVLTWDNWFTAVQSNMAKNFPEQHPARKNFGAATDWNVPIAEATPA